ncbi:MAG TPA: RluA family pseudouridine synthase [Vicinamibacterales bacterium]|nr:RluA family pseudouridine synthase [Vicinamibacterales bacterium]
MSPEPICFVADRGDAGRRLDQVLVRRVTEVSRLSRTTAQRWIEDGAVEVGARVVTRPSATVLEGTAIRVTLPPDAVRRVRPAAEPGALAVVHEDADLLVISKPAGVVAHPTYKQSSGTALNGLLWHLRDRGPLTPGILTRLDKDTSGLMIVALSPGVHAAAQRDAAAGRIRKEYLAVVGVTPRPRAGTIDAALARDPDDRRRVIVSDDGAPSETRYEVVASSPAGALVRCELVTGRTHQIRVHLSARGWPIVGDRVYGVADPRIGRQALHAWRVSMPHPVTRAAMVFEAPPPADFAALASLVERAQNHLPDPLPDPPDPPDLPDLPDLPD